MRSVESTLKKPVMLVVLSVLQSLVIFLHVICCLKGGVSPEKNLHSHERGVGWKALRGPYSPGSHGARRRDVCLDLSRTHEYRSAPEDHQPRGVQLGSGRGVSGDVSQRPQEGGPLE